MPVPRSRILDLMKAQCELFSTVFNPNRLRLGTKILRQRLRGPALAAYYPRREVTMLDLKRAYPEFQIIDEDEEERLLKIESKKVRGKGAPKKRRTAAESKKFSKQKKK